MASNSTDMYSDEEIREMQKRLLETPADRAYADVYYDGRDPEIRKQCMLNFIYNILKKLDKLPPGVE